MTKILKGVTIVREVQPKPFEGLVTEFRVDGENGDVQYKVVRQVMNEDGSPKMVEDRHGDSCDHDERGTPLLDKSGAPVSTGEMTNVRTEMVPVYEEKFFTREQIEIVSE